MVFVLPIGIISSGEESSSSSGITKQSQVMGSFDEILDIALIRDASGDAEEENEEDHEEVLAIDRPMRVAVISNSPHVQIMDSSAETINLLGHEDVVLSVDASPDGKWLVTSSKDRTCRVWSVDSYACVGGGGSHGCRGVCCLKSADLHIQLQAGGCY